jgi:hypothetical protein
VGLASRKKRRYPEPELADAEFWQLGTHPEVREASADGGEGR